MIKQTINTAPVNQQTNPLMLLMIEYFNNYTEYYKLLVKFQRNRERMNSIPLTRVKKLLLKDQQRD